MFFPFPTFLSCTHVLVLICSISKTDIRDLCGAFHLNIRDRIAQWESSHIGIVCKYTFQCGLCPVPIRTPAF